jgi:predicted aldo/keto reductase-like oxidoreductase
MQYRADNISGNNLSILGMGCMRFPREFGKTEEMIIKAIEQGVNYFDTAYLYPGSEEALGTILAKHKLREKVYIATKLPLFLCKSASDFDKYFEKQLTRLKTEYIDYYLMHMLADDKRWKTLCDLGIEEWIKNKKAEGKIKRIGFSFHGTQPDFMKLLDIYDWEFCLIQYNYSDENYQAGAKGLMKAAEKGLPVMVMEPLLGGKLSHGLPEKAVKVFKNANPELSPAGWALKWLWNQPEITVLLSGMRSLPELEENIGIAKQSFAGMLSEQEKEAFENVKAIFNEAYKIKCTGCNYCMPCPQGVSIPECFSAYNTLYTMGKAAARNQYFMSAGVVSAKQHFASLCNKCGKCEKVCPQHIEIRNALEEVTKKLEPFWYRPVFAVVRKFLRINTKTESEIKN